MHDCSQIPCRFSIEIQLGKTKIAVTGTVILLAQYK